MDQNRIFALAVAELERQKAGIEEEIETLRNELEGTGAVIRQFASCPEFTPDSFFASLISLYSRIETYIMMQIVPQANYVTERRQ